MPEGATSSRAAALPPPSRPGTGAAPLPLAALSNGQGPLFLRGHRSDSLTESVADDASSMFSVSSAMDAVARSDSGLSALWQDDEFWQVGLGRVASGNRVCWQCRVTCSELRCSVDQYTLCILFLLSGHTSARQDDCPAIRSAASTPITYWPPTHPQAAHSCVSGPVGGRARDPEPQAGGGQLGAGVGGVLLQQPHRGQGGPHRQDGW